MHLGHLQVKTFDDLYSNNKYDFYKMRVKESLVQVGEKIKYSGMEVENAEKSLETNIDKVR